MMYLYFNWCIVFYVLLVKDESGHFSGQLDKNFTVYIIIISDTFNSIS